MSKRTAARAWPRLNRRNWLAYGGATLLCLLILAIVLQLHRADLRAPFSYSGDAVFYHIITKGMLDHGWFGFNPSLGAPTGMNLNDVPTADHNFYLLLLRLFAFFTSNQALIINLFFLLSFPLTTLSALAVFRHFGVSWPPAIFGSLLYTFLPFHFARGQHHLFLSAYYFIPPMVMVILWSLSGALQFRWRNRRLIISLIICALIASSGTYYAFFACFFLLIAGLLAALERMDWRALIAPGALVAVIFSVTVFNLLPAMIHLRQHGDTPVVRRNSADSETYGLKLAQLLLPISHHRIYRVSALKGYYNQRAGINENDDAAMGAIGSGGLLALIALLFYRRRSKPAGLAALLEQLSLLNAAALLLATIGGFGALFAFLISPKIRAWNRISIWIAFFALFAVVLMLEYVWRQRAQTRARRAAFCALLAFALTVGVFDQTSRRFIPAYEQLKAEQQSDAAFVRQIESALPPDAAVFQLPVMSFPESARIQQMSDYDPARGYLHSRHLRWSYGVVRNREGDVWQKLVATKPLAEMIDTLCLAGFSGLWLDRFGYADRGAQLIAELTALLPARPLESSNGRLAFFDLTDYSRRLKEKFSAEAWAARQDEAINPLLTLWQDGFSDEEPSGQNRWRWCAEEGRMEIVNNSRAARQVKMEMRLAAGRDANLRIESQLINESLKISYAGIPFNRTLTIPPGRHTIRFYCDAPRIIAPLDPRILVFRLENFSLQTIAPASAAATAS
jgi:phosphoglycerol transferase